MPATPPSPPVASRTALWGGMITGRAARGCPTSDELPPWPTLPDAGAARDGPVLKTENGLGGVPRWPPRRTGCPGRGGEAPVTLSGRDRGGSVLGLCVTALPRRPNRPVPGPVLPSC